MSKSSMILFPQELKNIKFQGIYEATIEKNTVYINAYVNEFNLSERWVTIGRYNLDNKEGKILLGSYKDYKWYKNLKSLWNAIWKFDTNASMTDINVIKNKINEMKKDSKTENIEIKVVATINEVPEAINTVEDDTNNTIASTIETTKPLTNNIIEMVKDETLRIELYQALNNGFKIGYTSNLRGIPHATYEKYDNRLFIIINPSQLQGEYVSKYIYILENKIKELYNNEDIKQLNNLYHNDYNEFLEIIKEDARYQIDQYSYESILQYFDNFFKLDTIIPNTIKEDTTEKSLSDKIEITEVTNKTSHDILQKIYNIDAKLDILDDKYSSIQANRKANGLSLAIYKCSDPEALQLIEIDNKMQSLEKLQDDLQQERKQLATKEYHIRVNKWIKSYGNKKYKIVINHNETMFTDNFHEVISQYINNNKIKIQVFKLIYLNHEKYLPYEINIYNKFINEWNLLEENRYYLNNDGYLLEKQLYYNHTLINKFIYRGYSHVSAYIYKTNNKEQIEYNMFAHINNIKQNYGVEIYKENNNITCSTNTNIALGDYVKGLTSKGQELLNKIKRKYSKDKYININELIAV
jgi:hypothetical protein